MWDWRWSYTSVYLKVWLSAPPRPKPAKTEKERLIKDKDTNMLWREASTGRPVREEVQRHTFGPKHGRVAGMVAVGLAFMLQRKEEGLPPSQLLWLLPLPPSSRLPQHDPQRSVSFHISRTSGRDDASPCLVMSLAQLQKYRPHYETPEYLHTLSRCTDTYTLFSQCDSPP